MRVSAAGGVTMLLALFVSACGGTDNAAREGATADSARLAAPVDTQPAPRVVPYNPSAPGAMRSGDEPIRAETPRAPAPAAKTPAPAKQTPSPRTPPTPEPTSSASRSGADSVGDPVEIVRDYYGAIRAHDFLRAYEMWDLAGQSNRKSFAQFEAGFDSTESVDVRTGVPGRVEGAAGSRFITVPVEIDSRLRDGTHQRFTGTYTLRRVVVPGASAAQRRWHLYAANIRQVK